MSETKRVPAQTKTDADWRAELTPEMRQEAILQTV